MKKIEKDEMFGNLKDFLQSKGIELQKGSYAERIRRGCELLTDSINVGQETLGRAKTAVDKSLDQLRQTIHKQTAPRSRPGAQTRAKGPSASKTKAPPAGRQARKKK